MESWYSKVTDVCEALDWRVSTPKEDDHCWEFEKYSQSIVTDLAMLGKKDFFLRND